MAKKKSKKKAAKKKASKVTKKTKKPVKKMARKPIKKAAKKTAKKAKPRALKKTAKKKSSPAKRSAPRRPKTMAPPIIEVTEVFAIATEPAPEAMESMPPSLPEEPTEELYLGDEPETEEPNPMESEPDNEPLE